MLVFSLIGAAMRRLGVARWAAFAIFTLLSGGCALSGAPKVAPNQEIVVLLHGLGRGVEAMNYLAVYVDRSGFQSCSVAYPSRLGDLDELVDAIREPVDVCLEMPHRRVHFVAHSLGGIVTRAYLASYRPPALGRVVMIATPNNGTELVDLIAEHASFAAALGPTAALLGTGDEGLPSRLPDPDFEFGIIAGNVSFNPVSSSILPGADDGYVSVESAQLDGMSDFLVVPASHALLRRDPRVASEVVHFLRFGRFAHLPESVPLGDN